MLPDAACFFHQLSLRAGSGRKVLKGDPVQDGSVPALPPPSFLLCESTLTGAELYPRKCRGEEELHLVKGQPTACTALCIKLETRVYGLNVSGCGLGKWHCCHSVITLLALTVAQTQEERAMQQLPQTREFLHPAPSPLQVVCYSKQLHLHLKQMFLICH